MAADRQIDSSPPVQGADFVLDAKEEIEALWSRASNRVGVTAGTASAYTAAASPALVTLTVGARVLFEPHVDCDAGPTLKIGTTTAKAIVGGGGGSLGAGALQAGTTYEVVYDGTNWILTSAPGVSNLLDLAQRSVGVGSGTSLIDRAAGDARYAEIAVETRTVTGAGLATGGGTLEANRVITVPAASRAETAARSSTTKAVTPDGLDAALVEVQAKTVSAAGLATGGGDLSQSRTITVPAASRAETAARSSTTKAVTPDGLDAALDPIDERLNFIQGSGAEIQSAATTDLSTSPDSMVRVLGTATIESFGVDDAGKEYVLRLINSGGTIKYNSSLLILPGAADIVWEAGDVAIFRSFGSGGWKCITYTRFSGRPIVDTAVDFASADRPGENYLAATSNLTGRLLSTTAISPSLIATDTEGRVVRVTGALAVAFRGEFRIETGRTYRLRYVVRRRLDTPDPANDAVRCAIRWLTSTSAGLVTGGTTVVQDLNDLQVTDGRTTVSVLVSKAAGAGIAVVAPAGAVYARPYVETFGAVPTTDVEIIQWEDVTDAVTFSPDLTSLTAEVDALQSLNLGPRVTTLEANLGGAEVAHFKTRAAAQAWSMDPDIDLVVTLGYSAENDRGGGLSRRITDASTETADWFSLDGARWRYVDTVVRAEMFGVKAGTGTDQAAALNAAIDYLVVRGGGELFLGSGTHSLATPVVLKTGVFIWGAGQNASILTGISGNTKLLQDHRFSGYNEYCGFRGLQFLATADVDVAVELAATQFGSFREFLIKNATKVGAIALKLTGWDDAGTFRHFRRNNLKHVNIANCYNGIRLTRATGFTPHEGPNFNQFDLGDVSGYQDKGVWIEHGEGNRFWGFRNETTFDNTVAWDIDDAVTTLIDCAADGVMFTSFVRLLTMVAGNSINQITVAGVNLFDSAVPFNTSLRQTAQDIVTEINSRSGTSGYSAQLSTKANSADVHILTAAGAKVVQGTDIAVGWTGLVTFMHSGPTDKDGGITGAENEWQMPEGHAGSNAIGFRIGDSGSAVIINPQGNGTKDRITFFDASAKAQTVILRSAEFYHVGRTKGSYLPEVSAVTPGNWSIVYATQGGTYLVVDGICHVSIRLTFTPTFTTASGNLQISLPLPSTPTSGIFQYLQLGNSKGLSFAAGKQISASITANTQVANLRRFDDTTSVLLAAADLVSGQEYTVNLHGWYFII